ncbi:MAG: DUF1232 domain-containing protein [Anaerolineae bacterium]|nr:DUF1232 domain-containing protein [Anaerolineae bacterium]MDW8101707.1 DUF1232 domain-containing protein [Anaerolineae bacterium]
MIAKLKNWAHSLEREAYALYVAARDPRVPWYARVFLSLVVAYTFSPIDLIPDFVPFLGHLDDLVLVPLGVVLALKMIPSEVMVEARHRSEELMQREGLTSRAGAILVIALWLVIVIFIAWSIVLLFKRVVLSR